MHFWLLKCANLFIVAVTIERTEKSAIWTERVLSCSKQKKNEAGLVLMKTDRCTFYNFKAACEAENAPKEQTAGWE